MYVKSKNNACNMVINAYNSICKAYADDLPDRVSRALGFMKFDM